MAADDEAPTEMTGKEAVVRCDKCDQPVPDDANFCPSCGTAVSPPTPNTATTSSLEIGQFDPEHEVDELPEVPAGMGMLVVVRGPNAGSRFLLDREEAVAGRHPDADIFLDDVTVSRRHAILAMTDDGIRVQDNGSLNGTYVNGDRVEDQTLDSGDELQIGRFKLLFVSESAANDGAAS